MAIDLLAEEPIDLLADQPEQGGAQSFYDLGEDDQKKVMEMAKKQIMTQHPNTPEWMVDMMLKVAPKDKSPMLESAARGMGDVANYIPAAAGGLLQGASIPIRGVAGLIPTEFTHRLANSPDLRSIFPQAEGTGQKSVQMAGELLGGGGLFGKLMQGVKGASALAHVPKVLQNPLALAGAGAIATPGDAANRALGAGGALALGGAGTVAAKAAGKAGEKLPAFLRGLGSKSTPEALVESVQKPHDVLQNTADELYGQVRQAIKKRGIKFAPSKIKGNFEKYEDGKEFGISHDTENAQKPRNNIEMKINGNNARVVHSVVEENQRGKGIGKSLYKEAINDAHKKGLNFESDNVVSDKAMNIYKSLEKEGYKFEFNPNIKEVNGHVLGEPYKKFESSDGKSPVVKLISSPKPEKYPLHDFLDQAREYFPKNKSSVKDLFESAKNGDYEAIHKIQSSLYKKGTKQLSGDDLVKENEGEEILDLRDKINSHLEKHLIKEGHIDVAHVLKQGKKTVAQLKSTYFDKLLPKGIGKMVHGDTRLIPEKPENLFTQNSVPMKNFLQKHPETAKHTQGIKEKEAAMKGLNKIFLGAGLSGGSLYGGKLLSDLFK